MDSKNELIHLQVLKGSHTQRTTLLDIVIYFCLAGSLRVEISDDAFDLTAQDILLVNSGVEHQLTLTDDAYVLQFSISRAELRRCFPESSLHFSCNSVTLTNDSIDLLRSYLQEYVMVHYEHTKLVTAEINKIFYEIASLLMSRFVDQISDSNSSERIDDILQYIDDHYFEPLSLRHMSETFFVTPQYFSKYFKERTGKKFHAYLQDIRLKHAALAIQTTDATLLHIALDNGFPNAESFRKVFTEHYGISPLAYRKQTAQQRKQQTQQQEELLDETVLMLGESHQVRADSEIFSVDTAKQIAYRAYWRDSISLGPLSLLENYELREQLSQLQKDLKFSFIRFTVDHILRNAEQLSFHFEERQFDFFYELNLREWIVIPFSETMPIDTYERYLRELIAYFANRYDITNVLSWRYELAADRLTPHNIDLYLRCFERLYAVLNSFGYPKELLGADVSLQDYESLSIWSDILSRYKDRIPVQTLRTNAEVTVQTASGQKILRASDSSYITDQLYTLARREPLLYEKATSTLVTAWSEDAFAHSALHDSCNRGAATIKNLIACFGEVASLTPSTPFDVTDATSATSGFLFGGAGLMTRDGLPKPTYFAYELMNRVGKRYLAKNSHAIVFSNGESNYQIICHNCKRLNYLYYTSETDINAQDLYRYFEDDHDLEITMRLVGARSGSYLIKKRSISPNAGSIQDELLRIYGTIPSYVHPNENAYLERVTTPRIEVESAEAVQDVLEFTIHLAANEFAQIHAIYQFE